MLKYNYGPGETPIERLRNKIQSLFGVVSLAEVDQGVSTQLKEAASSAAETFEDIKDLLDDAQTLTDKNK